MTPRAPYVLNSSLLHAQAFLYRPDIGLYLPEVVRISRLDIIPQALDLTQDKRNSICIFPLSEE
ncbi:MAG: hypothetical protein STSR0001_15970 [Methanothrix sp.]